MGALNNYKGNSENDHIVIRYYKSDFQNHTRLVFLNLLML